jgi:hypothetical protein
VTGEAAGPDHHRGVVERVPGPLAEAADDVDAEAGRGIVPGGERRTLDRLGTRLEAVAIDAVARDHQFGQDDEGRAVGRRRLDERDAARPVLRGPVERGRDLGDGDANGHLSGPASGGSALTAFRSGTSAGAGPPTLTMPTPRFALIACFTPTGTWTRQPAWNGTSMSLV